MNISVFVSRQNLPSIAISLRKPPGVWESNKDSAMGLNMVTRVIIGVIWGWETQIEAWVGYLKWNSVVRNRDLMKFGKLWCDVMRGLGESVRLNIKGIFNRLGDWAWASKDQTEATRKYQTKYWCKTYWWRKFKWKLGPRKQPKNLDPNIETIYVISENVLMTKIGSKEEVTPDLVERVKELKYGKQLRIGNIGGHFNPGYWLSWWGYEIPNWNIWPIFTRPLLPAP